MFDCIQEKKDKDDSVNISSLFGTAVAVQENVTAPSVKKRKRRGATSGTYVLAAVGMF